jgi:V-type H+-transporting ATPase subunit D
LCKSIFVLKFGVSELAAQAFFSLSRAEYAAGHFREKVFETERMPSVGIQSHTENVAGVQLPKLELLIGTHCTEDRMLGLSGGGRRVELCRDRFSEYLQTLVQLASLQASFWAMSEALKVTSRRVNAIENVVIPRLRDSVHYISR